MIFNLKYETIGKNAKNYILRSLSVDEITLCKRIRVSVNI